MATSSRRTSAGAWPRTSPISTAPVFALTGLPEVVKGALFARYSRSPKSLRRLWLDEFAGAEAALGPPPPSRRGARSSSTRACFVEYGDDSVAQLGGVHLAVEGASNLLTKVLEWGRLMAYLEQSTRYIPYDDRPGGRCRYHVPAELDGRAARPLRRDARRRVRHYAAWLPTDARRSTRRSSRGADGDSRVARTG